MGQTKSKNEKLVSMITVNQSLSKEEVLKLEELYNKYKDETGSLKRENLDKLLDSFLSKEVLNSIFENTSESLGKTFSFNDLKYFYYLLSEKNPSLRKKFLLLLIFGGNSSIKSVEYNEILYNILSNDDEAIKILLEMKTVKEITKNEKINSDNQTLSKLIDKVIDKIDFSYGVKQAELQLKMGLEGERKAEEDEINEIAADGEEKKTEKIKLVKARSNINEMDLVKKLDELKNGINNESDVSNTKKQKQKIPQYFNYNCECSELKDEVYLSTSNQRGGSELPNLQKKASKSFFNRRQSLKMEGTDNFFADLSDMKDKFKYYEMTNHGVFPLKLFEAMLYDIGVESKITNLIITFLKTKTQKNFVLFDQFRWLMEKFSINDNISKVSFLFRLLSNDKSKLHTKDLSYFLKSYYKLSSNEISTLLEKYGLGNATEFVSMEAFTRIFLDNQYSLESLEKIKYIPLIYFEIDCNEKYKQKNCVKLLLKNRGLKEYIEDNIEINSIFYLVNYSFWEDWKKYVSWDEEDSKIKNNEETSKKFKKSASPEIHFDSISASPAKLKDNLKYGKDYIVLTETLYRLFYLWYETKGSEISRKVIETDHTLLINEKLAVSAEIVKKKYGVNNYYSQLQNPVITKKFLEIEINPIFISFLKVEYLISLVDRSAELSEVITKKNEETTEKEVESLIAKVLTKKKLDNTFKANPYSRTIEFSKILSKFQDLGQIGKNSRLLVISDNRLFPADENSCFEKENTENTVVIAFDQFVAGKFEKDKYMSTLLDRINEGKNPITNSKINRQRTKEETKDLIKKLEIEENKRILIGIRNIGNSKF